MTNYCEPQDIEVLVRRLDLESANTDISTADITAIIERKSAYIDSALSKRYIVPFAADDIPEVITDLVIQFVIRQIEPNIGVTITGEGGQQLASAYDPEDTLYDYVNGINSRLGRAQFYPSENLGP